MSLMNDVLQQLDLRHPQQANVLGGMPISGGAPIKTTPWVKISMVAGCLSLGVTIGTLVDVQTIDFIKLAKTIAPAAAINASPAPVEIVAAPAEFKAASAVNVASILPPEPAAASEISPQNSAPEAPPQQNDAAQNAHTQNELKSDDVSNLLQEANGLLADDKLMQPIGNCAFSRYRQVLLLEPNNVAAQAGIETIKSRYKRLFDAAIAQENVVKAKLYLGRMLVAGVDSAALQIMNTRLLEKQQAIDLAQKPTAAEQVGGAGINENGIETKMSDALTPTPINSANTAYSEAVVIAPTTLGDTSQADLQLAKQALAGKLANAKNSLLGFINTHAAAPESEFALAQLYCDEKNGVALQAILEQSTQQSAARKAFLRAKLALLQRDYSAVIHALETQAPEPSFAQEHQRLLAVALQNSLQYAKAADLYKQLVQAQPKNASLWLGLAVCEDAQVHTASALAAFNQAYVLGGHSSGVQNYLRERINALSI